MNVAILGYGIEGKSAEKYFQKHGHTTQIFDHFNSQELASLPLDHFDLVLRSPSVKLPLPAPANWSSATNYFFEHCPAPIIAVTGTKGKGTTATILAHTLHAFGKTVHLLGNIGSPALDSLDKIQSSDIVIFELSSFQAWDLKISPAIAILLRIEPEHLNVHYDFHDYLEAKANITKHQSPANALIYFADNQHTNQIAQQSSAQKIAYPVTNRPTILAQTLQSLSLVGSHNQENAEAALLAAHQFIKPNTNFEDFLSQHSDLLKQALSSIPKLPHRLEFVANINGVDFYDDNFSSSYPALEVALKTFANRPVILIAGGEDRGLDLKATRDLFVHSPQIHQLVLIGETAPLLATPQAVIADSLATAVQLAFQSAIQVDQTFRPVVLMSPGAASHDMFIDFKDRGQQFQAYVQQLKNQEHR